MACPEGCFKQHMALAMPQRSPSPFQSNRAVVLLEHQLVAYVSYCLSCRVSTCTPWPGQPASGVSQARRRSKAGNHVRLNMQMEDGTPYKRFDNGAFLSGEEMQDSARQPLPRQVGHCDYSPEGSDQVCPLF